MGLCWRLQMGPPAKAVLIALADMANDEGYCWPSLERLCERTCFGRTAVINAIAWLEAHGIVRPSRSTGRSTTYWVEPEKFTAEAVDNPVNPSASHTGTAGKPVRHADRTRPPRGPDPSARRTLIVKNRQEPKAPQPPANAGGERDATQMPAERATGHGGFEAFWRAYPRKTGEMRARRQWARLNPNPALQMRMLAAVEAQTRCEQWNRDGGRWVPMPSTWLHGERWRDVLDAGVPAVWWESSEGVKAMGESLGLVFDLAELGNAYTDERRLEHWRAYRGRVFEAAGSGPWAQRRVA